jgi:hypothetical protein
MTRSRCDFARVPSLTPPQYFPSALEFPNAARYHFDLRMASVAGNAEQPHVRSILPFRRPGIL